MAIPPLLTACERIHRYMWFANWDCPADENVYLSFIKNIIEIDVSTPTTFAASGLVVPKVVRIAIILVSHIAPTMPTDVNCIIRRRDNRD